MSGFDRIPAELRARDQWAGWRWETRDGKPTKPPYRVDDPSQHASSTKPETWGTFEQAVAAVVAGDADGIGFALAPPFVGVDLDAELPLNEQYAIMLALDSYAEKSPSGAGHHVIVKASLNGHGRHPVGIGVFQTGRFFYCTGEHVNGTPTTIEERQNALEHVIAEYLPKSLAPHAHCASGQPVDLDDQELLERAFSASNGEKFRRLWDGDWSGYPSQSEADLALAMHLAFWTGRDAGRMESMFRASGLHRGEGPAQPKGIGYLARTIEKAIAGTDEVYEQLSRKRVPTPEPSESALLEPRGVPTDFAGVCDLGAVLDAFGELLVMPDPGAVEVALAAIVANYAPGDPVWPLLVGPPGCGKSEIVSALRTAPAVWSLSSLTPQTLLSGFERKGKDKGMPASMLLQIGTFGILAFKDLTTVLSMHHEARSQIISQLREVADGRTEKSFGNGLRLEWEGKLGLVAGVTPIIDEQHAFLAVMGERFVLYRMPEVSRPEIARRSLTRRGREQELREHIVTLVATFLAQFRNVGRLELPERFTEPIITLSDIVTRARSGVARDRQTRDILYLPEPEVPTRFAKQIAQLMAAAIRIGVSEAEAWRLARKVGWDSVPAVRSAVIHLLARQEGAPLKLADLETKTGLPKTTVTRVVEDLVVLGLADRQKESSADNAAWLISESKLASDYWDEAA
jgi:putative DNA primase/helicase